MAIPIIAVVAGAGAGAALGFAVTNPASHGSTHPAGAGPSTPTTAPSSFSKLLTTVGSGVVLIEATACSNDDIGTGFLIAPNLVATAAHVVKDAHVIALRSGASTTVGRVAGIDPTVDLALIEAATPINGHIFSLAGRAPVIGEPVAAVGFPSGPPAVLASGTVTDLNRTVPFNGQPLTGLTLTNAPVSSGDSGGPLLDAKGTVVGVVDHFVLRANGLGYALNPAAVAPLLQRWQASPATVPPGACATAVGPAAGQDHLHPAPLSPAGQQIVTVLKAYFTAINAGDWAQAFSYLTDQEQLRLGQAALASQEASSYLFDFALIGPIQNRGPGKSVADVSFSSIQDADKGPNGLTCVRWRLAYSLNLTPVGWRIDATAGQGGGPRARSCVGS